RGTRNKQQKQSKCSPATNKRPFFRFAHHRILLETGTDRFLLSNLIRTVGRVFLQYKRGGRHPPPDKSSRLLATIKEKTDSSRQDSATDQRAGRIGGSGFR